MKGGDHLEKKQTEYYISQPEYKRRYHQTYNSIVCRGRRFKGNVRSKDKTGKTKKGCMIITGALRNAGHFFLDKGMSKN